MANSALHVLERKDYTAFLPAGRQGIDLELLVLLVQAKRTETKTQAWNNFFIYFLS